MTKKEEQAKEILKEYNQQHIIKWIDKSNNQNKETIINQVLDIDLEELEDLYEKVKKGIIKKNFTITPINAVDKNNVTANEKIQYIELGEKVIKNNEYAVVTMAGGQGTRLRA